MCLRAAIFAIICHLMWPSSAQASSLCTLLLSSQEKIEVETIIEELGAEKVSVIGYGLPIALVDGPQQGHQLVMTNGFNFPIAIKVPSPENSVWNRLNKQQKIYLLYLIEKAFRKNTFDSRMNDNSLVDFMAQRLGLNWADIQKHRKEQWQAELFSEELPLWMPKFFRQLIQLLRGTSKDPGKYTRLARELLSKAFSNMSLDERAKIRGISARKAFALAYQKRNCVGACRHASSLMAPMLVELGVPIEDVKMDAGVFVFPIAAHAWLQVKVEDGWYAMDPTPKQDLVPLWLHSGVTDIFKSFFPILFPWLRDFTESALIPFWEISSDESGE